jgi:hypothetical protein
MRDLGHVDEARERLVAVVTEQEEDEKRKNERQAC